MSFEKIVGFGDSWMYGDELIDPALLVQDPQTHSSWTQNRDYRERYCFLGQLGVHYGVPTENYGIPGGSLQSTIWTFLNWFQKETTPSKCLILIGLTESDRFTLWNPDGNNADRKMVHSTWAQTGASEVPKDFATVIRQQIALCSGPEIRSLNYQQTVLLFDGVSARNNLQLLQFHVAAPPVKLSNTPSLIWPDFSWTKWFVQELQADYGRKYIHANGHPNELGHELIRDRLISYVDSCILNGC